MRNLIFCYTFSKLSLIHRERRDVPLGLGPPVDRSIQNDSTLIGVGGDVRNAFVGGTNNVPMGMQFSFSALSSF